MKQYIADAFTEQVFAGNPAAVCVTEAWLPDAWMQQIAAENNLSETAFTVKDGDHYCLRWFTPKGEIDFCGHATLAAAYILLRFYEPDAAEIRFRTQSGILTVRRDGARYQMDFPAYPLHAVPVTDDMTRALGITPAEAYRSRDLMLVLEHADDVRQLQPDLEALKMLCDACVAVTAPDTSYDCISRVFAPALGVPEDPVTGSTHCMIVPYWCRRLQKHAVTAYQASVRGGILHAEIQKDRVFLSGNAVLYAVSDILPDGMPES